MEGPAAGTDSAVLSIFGPIAAWTATANDAWLHLSAANQSGSGSTNVVFTFDPNPGATRTGTLTVLGQSISINQTAAAEPVMGGPVWLPDGSFQINFTGTAGASYSVLHSTNPALPLSDWTVIGTATNTSGSQFQYTAPPSPGTPAGFFLLSSP